jgi:hypothetical protein
VERVEFIITSFVLFLWIEAIAFMLCSVVSAFTSFNGRTWKSFMDFEDLFAQRTLSLGLGTCRETKSAAAPRQLQAQDPGHQGIKVNRVGIWAGVLCPTDEAIAHLLMMRGSEEKFSANANQHPLDRPASGL